jgi:hypothetical protein
MTWKQAGINTLVVFAIALAYVGFRIYQRGAEDAAFQKQRAEERREKPLPEIYKSEKLEILGFYVSPRRITRGDKASLCYGVLNAKSLSIEPSVGELSPSMSRCASVSPAKTTTYTFKALDAAGAEKTAEATLTVN